MWSGVTGPDCELNFFLLGIKSDDSINAPKRGTAKNNDCGPGSLDMALLPRTESLLLRLQIEGCGSKVIA